MAPPAGARDAQTVAGAGSKQTPQTNTGRSAAVSGVRPKPVSTRQGRHHAMGQARTWRLGLGSPSPALTGRTLG